MATKYVFVTGGVVSSLGKGIFASSLGLLLKSGGLRISMMKLDPYLNIDPGTMSPYQHGEVYVTEDGAETDLDLGHYERWIDENLTKESSLTSGKVYMSVMDKERRGDYLGACIQVIPHVTDEIKMRIREAARVQKADVIICEIGGTVGDIESLPFLEAIREMRLEEGFGSTLFVHNTLVPYLRSAEETKTKPTQHSVKELLSLGIQPDAIVLRTEVPLTDSQLKKISLFCNVPPEGVFTALDEKVVYDLPVHLHEQGLESYVLRRLGLEERESDLSSWKKWVDSFKERKGKVRIALVGKYVELKDAYLSVKSALVHAGTRLGRNIEIDWIKSSSLTEENCASLLGEADGILVPGGFGERGSEGKKVAIRYARGNGVPFLGICFGMQLAIIEFAQHVLGWEDADSAEFDPHCARPVIDLLRGQYDGIELGGTMRLGNYPCLTKEGSLARKLYGQERIEERHRHRYEFNSRYKEDFERTGLSFSGINPDSGLVEIIELPGHPYFVASQFHPEFTSRPLRPNPLFLGFVEAAMKRSE